MREAIIREEDLMHLTHIITGHHVVYCAHYSNAQQYHFLLKWRLCFLFKFMVDVVYSDNT